MCFLFEPQRSVKGSSRIPDIPDPVQATRFVLELDLKRMTQDELDYLHKLRNMAQRQIFERYIKRAR